MTNQPDGWCFDPSGNLLSKTASSCPPGYPSFAYDGEDQMTSAPPSGVSYVYDGHGTRVKRCLPNCTSPTSWTVYLFSGSRDIAEYDNGAAVGSPSREFIYSGGVPGSGLLASVTSGSTLTYFHSDHLGWRVSTNTSGQVVGQQGQYPYGESWYSQNGNEFMFTSYQYDTQSALYYAMARYYDSSAGRFCSADPVGGSPGDPQSWNRYPYSRNDPIDITDPSGQKGFWSWLSNLFRYLMAFLTGGAVNPYGTKMGTPPFSPVGEQPPSGGIPGGGVISESGGFGGMTASFTSGDIGPPGTPQDWWTSMDLASGLVETILSGSNDCSKFFNSSPLIAVGGSYAAYDYFENDAFSAAPSLQGGDVEGGESPEGGGWNSRISINSNPSGAFLNPNAGTIGTGDYGQYQSGTTKGQGLMLLHELAHTLDLIPPDTVEGNPDETAKRSQKNNDTILQHCKKAIDAYMKAH